MKLKLKRILTFPLVVSLLLTVLLLPVSSYKLVGYKWNKTTIHYYYDSWVGTRATTFFKKGATAWNNRCDAVTISAGSGNDVYFCITVSEDVEWDGLTSYSYNQQTGYVISQTVTINQGATKTWSDDGALQSVVAHEIGHIYGLADNDHNPTIMNGYTWGGSSRYGSYYLTVPQYDDLNGVNELY